MASKYALAVLRFGHSKFNMDMYRCGIHLCVCVMLFHKNINI